MSEPKHYCKDCKNFLEFVSTCGICRLTKDYTQIFWTCDKWEYISYEEREELKRRAREYRKKKREAEEYEGDGE